MVKRFTGAVAPPELHLGTDGMSINMPHFPFARGGIERILSE